jgi:hypothetical protein
LISHGTSHRFDSCHAHHTKPQVTLLKLRDHCRWATRQDPAGPRWGRSFLARGSTTTPSFSVVDQYLHEGPVSRRSTLHGAASPYHQCHSNVSEAMLGASSRTGCVNEELSLEHLYLGVGGIVLYRYGESMAAYR